MRWQRSPQWDLALSLSRYQSETETFEIEAGPEDLVPSTVDTEGGNTGGEPQDPVSPEQKQKFGITCSKIAWRVRIVNGGH